MSYSDTFTPSGLPHFVYPQDTPIWQDINTGFEIINDALAKIDTDATAAAADINSISATVGQLNQTLSVVNDKVKALTDSQVADRGDIDANAANINKLQGDYLSQDKRLETAENDLASFDSDISALQSTVLTNTQNITANAGEISSIKQDGNRILIPIYVPSFNGATGTNSTVTIPGYSPRYITGKNVLITVIGDYYGNCVLSEGGAKGYHYRFLGTNNLVSSGTAIKGKYVTGDGLITVTGSYGSNAFESSESYITTSNGGVMFDINTSGQLTVTVRALNVTNKWSVATTNFRGVAIISYAETDE